METLEYRTVDKADWGPGPWQSEPDKKQWRDPETGLACLVVRGPSGALCGYVGVEPGHPLHGKDYDGADMEVHGGLTFADSCGHGDDPSEGICHIPGAGEPDDVWWFGFDCGHYGDLSPAYAALPSPFLRGGVYRDLAYVESEVQSLARQLARAAISKAEGRA